MQTRDSHMMDLRDRAFVQVRNMEEIQLVGPPPSKPDRSAITTADAATANGAADQPASTGVQQASASAEGTSVEIGSASGTAPLPPAATRPDAVEAAAQAWRQENGRHAVQVGAYRRLDQAQAAALRAQDRVPQLLSEAQVSVTRTQTGSSPIYRARLVGLSSQRAEQSCGLLASMGNDCLVIQSHSGFEMALND